MDSKLFYFLIFLVLLVFFYITCIKCMPNKRHSRHVKWSDHLHNFHKHPFSSNKKNKNNRISKMTDGDNVVVDDNNLANSLGSDTINTHSDWSEKYKNSNLYTTKRTLETGENPIDVAYQANRVGSGRNYRLPKNFSTGDQVAIDGTDEEIDEIRKRQNMKAFTQ
jgi:hypothetical protein